MNDGLMWYGGIHPELVNMVQAAAERYKKKYGRQPNVALINHLMLDEETVINGIRVIPSQKVLINNIWIGVQE